MGCYQYDGGIFFGTGLSAILVGLADNQIQIVLSLHLLVSLFHLSPGRDCLDSKNY